MIFKDEVVAARRLQAVINSDILDFVTSHIREHQQGPEFEISYFFKIFFKMFLNFFLIF